MRTFAPMLFAAALLLPLAVGCGPKPIVEQPPAENPSVDVNINPNGEQPPATETAPADEKAKVDVQVGGGQGVQVDVNESAPQQ
ncbi:MAG: hypothetical protein AB7G28_13495 [Pirellulales bacterium]